MTAPVAEANVRAVLDFANLDREFSDRLNTATRSALQVVERNLSGITAAARDTTTGVNRAFDRIVVNLDMRGVERSLDRAESAAESSTQAIQSDLRATGDAADDAAEKAGGFGEVLGKLAGAAAGLAGVSGIVDGIFEALDRGKIAATVGAQLDLTKEEAAQAGQIAGNLYAQNYGESFEQISEAGAAVLSTLGNIPDDGVDVIQDLTARALTLSDVMGADVASSTQTVNNLIRQGLAKDAVEGFDLLAAASQRVPLAMREELIPLIDEYGTFFSSLGFNGQEAFGILVNASEQGAIAMDKVGDALKETGIRATDIGDKAAQDALTALGLNATDTANALLAGGEKSKLAFQQMVDGLLRITDPAEQAAQATALFGTPLEDLSKAEIPAFLQALSGGDDAMAEFQGTVDEMSAAVAAAPGASFDLFKRKAHETFVNGMESAISGVMSLAGWLSDNKQLFTDTAIAVGLLGTALIAMNLVAVTGAVVGWVAAMRAAVVGTKLWTAATVIFNAVANANPFVRIALLIGALVAAIVIAYRNSETFRNVVQAAWAAIQSAAQAAWAFLQPIFAAIAQWVTGTLVPALISFWNGAKAAFDGIAQVVMYAYENFIAPALRNLMTIIGAVSDVVMWLWRNVFEPFFSVVGSLISAWWSGIVQPTFGFLMAGVQAIGDIFTWLKDNVFGPVFGFIGDKVTSTWALLSPVFDFMMAAADKIGGAFSKMGEIIKSAWDGILGGIRTVVHFIGDLLTKIPEKLGPIEIPGAGAANDLGEKLKAFRNGGLFRGRGGPRSDSNLVQVSDGEYWVNAAATKKNLGLLEAINSGKIEAFKNGGMTGGGTVSTSDNINELQQSMWDAVRAQFPDAVLSSATRTSDVGSGYDFHMQGKAIDISGPNMGAIASWLSSNYPGSLELIYGNGFGGNIDDGKPFQFDAGTLAAHNDHVHWAMASAPTGSPTLSPDAQAAVAPPATEEDRVADAIIAEGRKQGVSDKGIRIALATALAESGLRNLESGPDTSVGSFQQQDWYGTKEQRMDPTYAASKFYEDLKKQDYENMAPEAAAQAVQRSAFSDGSNYKAQQDKADQVFASRGGSGGGGGSSSSTSSTTGGDGQRVFVTNWPGNGSMSASSSSSLSSAASTATSGVDTGGPMSSAGGPSTGLAAANTWAAEQDFGKQANDWAFDAFKEITGQFTEPFGLGGVSGKAIDDLKTAAEALAAARSQEQAPIVGTMIVNGNGAQDTADAVVNTLGERMNPVTSRYRNGG